MKRFPYRLYLFSVCLLFAALCLPAGTAGAVEELTWPIQTKLVRNYDDAVEVWSDVGEVSIWNTRGELKIDVVPYAGFRIEKLAVHIVADAADFAAVLDDKGKPDVGEFTYVTEFETAVPLHRELIDLGDLDVCWSVKPEICPPDRYVVVAVDLQGVEERAFALSDDAFYRYKKGEIVGEGIFWGFYVTYPLAKVEPGHFVDANVSGLTYRTPTQEGITGEEGQFWWLPGERVGFHVGNLPLGNALADRSVSPEDLFPGADLEDGRVLNVARLLQSLDGDGNPGSGSINITEPVLACLNDALAGFPPSPPEVFFADDAAVEALISATIAGCDVPLVEVSKAEALENLASGMRAGNLMKRNVSKTPGAKSDKAQIEILPVYVPARRSDGVPTAVDYYDADGTLIETRGVAKPIVVSYVDEVQGAYGTAMDVFVAISTDDGDTWKRRNLSRTADKSSLLGYPGKSWKPMLRVVDNMIFVAWTDKYCRGGRPGYSITVCPDTDGDGQPDPCEICRDTADGTICEPDYPGDDPYWQDDLYGVGGPQRTVLYEDHPDVGEVPYSCVWATRGVVEASGDVQWFKPERVTSGRRDAFQLTAQKGEDVAFAIVWQEDPKGLMSGEGDGPGDGWSGANTHNKADIWMSYIKLSDFAKVDYSYPTTYHGDGDVVDTDPELAGRVKALVPMSIPVRVSDNEVCSAENMDPDGGNGEHDYDEEGEGTHRYCGTLEGIGTAEEPGTNPLCAYTIEKANPNGEIHNVCVTADGRLLDGNTGASRPNLVMQPYKRPDGTKSTWVVIGYEESKGVGVPPEHDDEEEGCGGEETGETEDDHDTVYKPDMGKNVIYHSFDLFAPELVAAGGILNLPETDAYGNPVYVLNEDGSLFLDWKGDPILAYENARRVRFLPQPKSKAGPSGTVLVALYRQGEEGSGKPADIFMRRVVSPTSGNPYAFKNFRPGAQNLTSVTPTQLFQDPFDAEKPVKMLRWSWSPSNLADSSARTPYSDARAHRGALIGDAVIVGYTWTPNWGRKANDKYDLYVHRSFDGGQSFTTDPGASEPIEHNVVFRVPILDYENQTVIWEDEVVTTTYGPGATEPPRNVSNVRNNRTSVEEPRLVKTPGTILTEGGYPLYPEDVNDQSVYQLAWGVEFNQNQLPDDVVYPKIPLDIYYGRTLDKGQRYESVIVTPQGGSGSPEDGWNLLAKDHPDQGGAQIRQTPDGSRMYGIWLEESDQGSDIMFRRVDYR
jgi:hypothetical protein